MTPPTNTEGAVTDVAAIARGLTEAQKQALEFATLRAPQFYGPDSWEVSPGSSRRPLERLGLLREREWRGLTGRSHRGYALTPLGIAVRSHLTSQGVTAS